MNKSKKLFNSEDFDKKKPLFEPEDFDKPAEENQKDEKRQIPESEKNPSSPYPAVKSSKPKFIGALVVAAVIITGGIFFANNDKANNNGSNKLATEAVAQEGEKYDADSNESTTESNDKTVAMTSEGAEGKSAANEATPKSYAADESHVTTSTEKSSTSHSEKSDNNVDGDVETNARRVIRGDFGNGQERRDKLGSSYSEIQGKVNEMYRQGIVN